MDGKTIRAWCLYDWANSAFATTVMAALFPPFFRSLAIAGGLASQDATAYWGYTTSLALLLIALTAPILGAVADHTGGKKRFLAVFAGLGILATAAFALLGASAWRWAALLFVAGNIGFAGSIVFYESLLPHITTPQNIDRISSYGYALGYAGGGLLLIVNVLWITHPDWFGLAGMAPAVKLSFLSVAIWWGIFSVPLLRHVPEPRAGGGERGIGALSAGVKRLAETIRDLRRYRQVLLFLCAFWIYNDGIGTIVKMATAYGDEIGISVGDMTTALVLTQLIGIPCTLLFGKLAGRWQAKRAIMLGLAVYAAISAGGYFMRTATHFYILAILVGTVQGGCQALSRSLFGSMVPSHKSAEFFGFYATSAKFAGILGPLIFGVVSQLTGHSRLSIVSLVVFFVVGGAILTRVDVAAGVAAARSDSERTADPHLDRGS